MAFVFQAERIANTQSQQKENIGPGSYLKTTTFKNMPEEAYAPFGSTQPKLIQQFIKNPGVGSYEVSEYKDTNNSTMVFKCKNQLMVKVIKQQNSNFASKSKRFQTLEQDNNNTPCVGDYDIQGDILQKKNRQGVRSASPGRGKNERYQNIQGYLQGQRQKIESIPQKSKQFIQNSSLQQQQQEDGYNVFKHIKKSKQQQQQQKSQESDIGPGFYEHKDIFERNKNKGCFWSKNKGKRFDQYQEKDVNVGPGKYINVKMSSKEPERMYANYASNTTRSFWDNIYFKSNKDDINKIHVQKNINTVQQGPSPDQYYVENYKSVGKQFGNVQDFEFFGCTEEKFKNQNDLNTKIGPGTYNISSPNFQTSKSFSPAFNSTAERVNTDMEKQVNFYPGPGEYDQNKISIANKVQQQVLKKGNKDAFIVNDERFKSQNGDRMYQPGPARYATQKDWIQNAKLLKSNAVFQSKTDRNLYEEGPKGEENDGGQFYNVNNFNIEKKLTTIQNKQDRLKNVNVIQPPFDQNEVRFKHYKTDDNIRFSQSFSPEAILYRQQQQQRQRNNNDLHKNQKIQEQQQQQQDVINFNYDGQNMQRSNKFQNSPDKNNNIPQNSMNSKVLFRQKLKKQHQSPKSNNLQNQQEFNQFVKNQNPQDMAQQQGENRSPQLKNKLHPVNQPPEQPFLSNAKKLDSIYKDMTQNIIGPGQYDVNQNQNWNLKSYNVKFQQNQKKDNQQQQQQNTNTNIDLSLSQ